MNPRKLLALIMITFLGQNSFAETTPEQFKQNQQSVSNMLAKPGTPSSSKPIPGMNAVLYYDTNGVASKVILSDGTSASVTEFLNSKDFNDFVGTDSKASLAERDEDTTPSGKPNLVPENYNGEVNVTTHKNADGSYNILEGIGDIAGGPFDRAYNGVSGSVPASPPLSDLEYNEKIIILTAQIWGVTEIAEKMCRPLDKDFPKSLSSWWIIIKNYVEAEKKRNALEKARAQGLKDAATQATTNAGGNSAIQLEGIRMQVEAINIAIDSLSGSSLYSGDKKAGDARATSRLAWREALLAATYQGIADSKAEDAKVVKAYVNCNTGINKSLDIAKKACDRKKTVTCSSSSTVPECAGITGDIQVSDPVPGSCEMVKTFIPDLNNKPMKDIATLYGVSPIPSKDMNMRLLRLASNIKKDVTVKFPKSNDANFDWTTPLGACSDPLAKPLKLNGVMCPANASDKDYDKTKFEKLGSENPDDEATVASKMFVNSPKDVTANAKLFLAAMGITEGSLDDTANLFTGYWNVDDLYFGQSNIRQTYFKYNEKIIGDLVLSDRSKLAQMLSDRQKLIDMYNKLKKILDDAQKAKDNKSSSGNLGSLAMAPSMTNGKTGSNTSMEGGDKNATALLAPNSSFDNISGAAAMTTSALNSLGKNSNGLLTLSSKDGNQAMNGSSGTQSYSVAQNKKINDNANNIKKLQKNLEDLSAKTKMKATNEDNSALKMAQLASTNLKPNYMGKGGIELLAMIGNAANAIPNTKDGESPLKKGSANAMTDANARDLYTTGNGESSSSSSGGSNSNGKSRKGLSDSLDAYSANNPSSDMGRNINYAGLSDDEKRIYDMIYARDKESKSKYDPKASDSLFDQITKAHIRNLERIK